MSDDTSNDEPSNIFPLHTHYIDLDAIEIPTEVTRRFMLAGRSWSCKQHDALDARFVDRVPRMTSYFEVIEGVLVDEDVAAFSELRADDAPPISWGKLELVAKWVAEQVINSDPPAVSQVAFRPAVTPTPIDKLTKRSPKKN